MSPKPFSGFPEEGLQFLADLGRNNNRDWFAANKQTYEETLVGPALAFIEALGPRLQTISPHIQYDTRTNGAGSLTRIYRDTRFSADKSPFKTWVGIRFWEGGRSAGQNPGFYIGFGATGGRLHVGMHGFDKAMLAAYRAAVDDDDLGAQLAAALASVRGAGSYQLNGQHYKRVPRGFEPDHSRADLLRYNTLYIASPAIAPEELASPELVDTVMAHCQNTAQVHRWLLNVRRSAPA
jgi:uncharacterized protein (TIGR02453 family)